MKSYYEATDIITEATLYLHQVHATRKFSFGTWTSRQHVFVSIKAGTETGYGENIVSVNQPDVSLGGLEGMASGAGWFKRRRGD